MGHVTSFCDAPQLAKHPRSGKLPIPTADAGGLWHRQYELSQASRDLLAAAIAGDRYAVEKYLARLGLPNSCDSSGLTPLHAATKLGRADLVEVLLAHDARVTTPHPPNFDGPPLALAAHHGYLDCLEALLSAKALPQSLSNPYESTCVHRAAAEGHATCVRALLYAHPPTVKVMNRGGLAKTLLKPSELIANFKDANDRLPLHRAAIPGYYGCVDLLVKEGFSLLDETDFDGNSALHHAVVTASEDSGAQIADTLLKARGCVDLVDAQQRTALHLAAARARANLTSLLLSYGANVASTESLRGRTPLHIAARVGARDVCMQLLAARANIKAEAREGSGTALMCSAPECMDVLADAMRQAEKGTYIWKRSLLELESTGGLGA